MGLTGNDSVLLNASAKHSLEEDTSTSSVNHINAVDTKNMDALSFTVKIRKPW